MVRKVPSLYASLILMVCIGVKIYGFLTVPEDAKCGVCAHEIGHLGKTLWCILHIERELTCISIRLA
jgi:hypothetical protein